MFDSKDRRNMDVGFYGEKEVEYRGGDNTINIFHIYLRAMENLVDF